MLSIHHRLLRFDYLWDYLGLLDPHMDSYNTARQQGKGVKIVQRPEDTVLRLCKLKTDYPSSGFYHPVHLRKCLFEVCYVPDPKTYGSGIKPVIPKLERLGIAQGTTNTAFKPILMDLTLSHLQHLRIQVYGCDMPGGAHPFGKEDGYIRCPGAYIQDLAPLFDIFLIYF